MLDPVALLNHAFFSCNIPTHTHQSHSKHLPKFKYTQTNTFTDTHIYIQREKQRDLTFGIHCSSFTQIYNAIDMEKIERDEYMCGCGMMLEREEEEEEEEKETLTTLDGHARSGKCPGSAVVRSPLLPHQRLRSLSLPVFFALFTPCCELGVCAWY